MNLFILLNELVPVNHRLGPYLGFDSFLLSVTVKLVVAMGTSRGSDDSQLTCKSETLKYSYFFTSFQFVGVFRVYKELVPESWTTTRPLNHSDT